MSTSSILGGQRAPTQADGRDVDALGPSDSSDSGSDVQGEHVFGTLPEEGSYGAVPAERDSDTDASGTGERASAVPGAGRDGADIGTDQVQQMIPADALDGASSIGDPDAVRPEELAVDDDTDDEDAAA